MTRKSKMSIFFITGFLLIAAALVAYYMYNKGPVNVSRATAIEATPDELYTLYTSDSIAATQKFDNKVVKVTGIVTEVSKNNQEQQVVIIKTSNEGANINCTLEQAGNIKPGDEITLKGICTGLGQGDPDLGILGDLYLTRSVIAE